MRKTIRKITIITITLLLIISQTACGVKNDNQGVSKDSFALDTPCRIIVYGLDPTRLEIYEILDGLDPNMSPEDYALEQITRCYSLIGSYDNLLSKTKEGSDVYRINHANGEFVEVSEETIEILQFAIKLSQFSDGAFDVTVGTLTNLWNFKDEAHNGKVPATEDIEEALTHVGYQNILIDGNKVRLSDPKAEIDLGAIAKGYIADKATEFLKIRGVVSGIVNLGGNIVAIGNQTDKMLVEGKVKYNDMKIGISNPLDANNYLDVIEGGEKTVVTSGIDQRYFIADGVKYHHILDPKTGYPVESDLAQVSIVSPAGSSMLSDGLSTMFFVLGKEKVEELKSAKAEEWNELTFTDAYFLSQDNDKTILSGPEIKKGTEDDPIGKTDIIPNEKNMTDGYKEGVK